MRSKTRPSPSGILALIARCDCVCVSPAEHKKRGLLRPELRYPRVEDIPLAALRDHGYKSLLLDIDNTLVPRDLGQIPLTVSAWIAEVRASGLPCCLLSNNWHQVVQEYARELGLPLVYRAMKPLPFAYLRALGKIGAQRQSAALVGDQLFTDVLGAHLLGIATILVQPRSPTDLWYTRVFRRVEQRFRD